MACEKRIAVIGAGAWGTALANLMADAGQEVNLWSVETEVLADIRGRRENPKYLRGVKILDGVHSCDSLAETLSSAQWVICVIPTQVIRKVFTPHAKILRGKCIINAAKGIELKTHQCVSEIFEELIPGSAYIALSGPSFAIEVANRLPTAVTLASRDASAVQKFQKMISTSYFRAYTTDDVIGVELSGALKNVIALASGMVSGLRLGYNAQAAIINRGIVEISRMGREKGADSLTFLGLSGMGDLVLTCTGPLSRNRSLGVLLAQGLSMEEAQKKLEGVAEGFYTANSAFQLSQALQIEMPITEQVYRILYEGNTPQQALTQLMRRDLKHEWN